MKRDGEAGVGAVGMGKGDWKMRFTVLCRPKESQMQSSTQSQKQQNDLCSFPRQTIQYHSNPSLAPTINMEETEVEQFYDDLQDLLELTPKKDVLFITGH